METSKKKKYAIANRFRKNRLSDSETSLRAEVHFPNEVRTYTNIHYASAFSKKTFANNSDVDKITFVDTADERTWDVLR